MYVIELTGNFFTAMAFPSVTATVIFVIHLLFEASGIAYQVRKILDSTLIFSWFD
jgi:hypothetical protein